MKFFADQCVPESICKFLEENGHVVERLRLHIPQNSIDLVVLEKAQSLGAVLLSLNGDFAQIVVYNPTRYHGIFSLQVKNNPQELPLINSAIQKLLQGKTAKDFIGKLVIISASKVRIR